MMTWQVYDKATGRVLDRIEAVNHPAAVHAAQVRGYNGGAIGLRVETPDLRELDALRAKARAVVQHCAEVAGAEPKADDLGARERILARWVIETLGSVATSGGGLS